MCLTHIAVRKEDRPGKTCWNLRLGFHFYKEQVILQSEDKTIKEIKWQVAFLRQSDSGVI